MIPRRPALAALVSLISGILAHDFLPVKPKIFICAIALFVIIALILLHRPILCTAALAAAIFLTGAARAQLAIFFFPADHISLFTASTQRLADVQMRILDTPHLTAQPEDSHYIPSSQLATAQVTAVETLQGWQPATGKISIKLDPPLDALSAGQTIRALGFLTRPQPPSNPGEFDFAAYERRQDILAEFHVRRSASVRFIDEGRPPLLVRWREGARNLLVAGFPAERRLDEVFLRMLLLGDSDPQVAFLREDFQLAGTAYQLSISGLHIAILGGFVLLLLRLARVSPPTAIWISLFFIAIYASLALPSKSGWRALIVCIVTAIGWLARRPTDGLQILAIAVIAILLLNPDDLYDPGLQIGVAAVLSLILFARPVFLFFSGLGKSQAIRIGPAPQPKPLTALAIAAVRLIFSTLLASAIIWVWILPLVALYFQQTSPWSIPGGLLLLPLTIAALLAGAGKIVLTLLCPWLAPFWAEAALIPTAYLRTTVARLSNLPAAGLAMVRPPWWVFLLYYSLLLLPLIPWQRAPFRWSARLAWIPACMALLVLPSPAFSQKFSPATPGLRLTLLSIGSGQAALVQVNGGPTFLIDCGSTTDSELYRNILRPYLLHRGIRRVDYLFLSDSDTSRISAAAQVIRACRIPQVHMSALFRRRAPDNLTIQSLLDLLDRHTPPPSLHVAGDNLSLGPGTNLAVLWPPANCSMTAVDCGMVLKLTCAGRSILFPADIGVGAEQALLKHSELLQSDVLIAQRHGSADRATANLLRAVNPKIILCSNGGTLTREEQAFNQLARSRKIYRTASNGAIEVNISGSGDLSVSPFVH